MSKALEELSGITAGFQYPVQIRFNELMTGARQDVVCKYLVKILRHSRYMRQKWTKLFRP
jgi:cobalt-zinc-cadmium resistance protein CzcA